MTSNNKDWNISYNPDTTQGFMGDRDGGPETALIMDDMPCGKDGHMWTGKQYFILRGDFRKEYEKCEGKWDCKQFYDSKKNECGSRWSSDFGDFGIEPHLVLLKPKTA